MLSPKTSGSLLPVVIVNIVFVLVQDTLPKSTQTF